MIEWTVSKAAMEAAVNLLNFVPSRNGVISSEFIRMETFGSALKLTLNSDLGAHAFIGTSVKLNLKGSVHIDRRMLGPFVLAGKDLSAEYYTFRLTVEEKSKVLVIKHGTRTSTFDNNSKAAGYEDCPDLTKAKSFEISEKWASLMGCAKRVATEDLVVPHLNAAYCYGTTDGGITVMSTDIKNAFLGTLPASELPAEPIAFPLQLIDAMRVENNGVLQWTKNYAVLVFPNGRIWQAVKTEARKSFPHADIEKLVALVKKGSLLLTIPSASLALSTTRLASYLAAAPREDLVLHLFVKAGSKILRLQSSAVGVVFDETLKLSEPSAEEVHIEWPLEAVIPILNYAKSAGEAKIYRDEKGRTCFVAGKLNLVVSEKEKGGRKVKK